MLQHLSTSDTANKWYVPTTNIDNSGMISGKLAYSCFCVVYTSYYECDTKEFSYNKVVFFIIQALGMYSFCRITQEGKNS